jgi:hypothetical protein
MKGITYKGFKIRHIEGEDIDPKYNFLVLNMINEIVDHARTLLFAKKRVDLFHAK